MTLSEFKELLLAADPAASHYESKHKPNYTVWAEHGENSLLGDGVRIEHAPLVQIDRFTKIESDPVAQAITDKLDESGIAYEYLADYEPDTGYIHHIWDCEVD